MITKNTSGTPTTPALAKVTGIPPNSTVIGLLATTPKVIKAGRPKMRRADVAGGPETPPRCTPPRCTPLRQPALINSPTFLLLPSIAAAPTVLTARSAFWQGRGPACGTHLRTQPQTPSHHGLERPVTRAVDTPHFSPKQAPLTAAASPSRAASRSRSLSPLV